jgi:hypothetical protein
MTFVPADTTYRQFLGMDFMLAVPGIGTKTIGASMLFC